MFMFPQRDGEDNKDGKKDDDIAEHSHIPGLSTAQVASECIRCANASAAAKRKSVMVAEPRKVRILHLRATQFYGGPEKQILHHAIRASSSGVEIWLGSFRDGQARPEFLERAEKAGLPTIELGSGRFNPGAVFELAHVLRKNKISLICTHGYKANLLGWAATRLTRCTQIAFARGWTGENWRVGLYQQLDRLVLARADWVVCVSRPLAEEIARIRAGCTSPLIIPNAALLPFHNDLPSDRLASRKVLGLSPNHFCICAAGRLSPEKGHRYLLHAVAELTHSIPKLLLVLLGEGRERMELEQHAAWLGIEKHVMFCGFRKDIRPWIEASDLLVNPSLTEGTPNVVLEAMAVGTPVIATSVGGVPDVIEHLNSGFLVAPADPNALAAGIHRAFLNPSERSQWAQHARKRLFDFSPEKQTQTLNELYATALRNSEQARVSSAAGLAHSGLT